MTNEERDLIVNFVSRVGGSQASGFGSVPSTNPAMPPIDREADAFIAEQFARYPEARYRITQLAFVQEHALAEAQNQLARMQADLQAAREQLQQIQQAQPASSPWGAAAPQPQQSRGFLGGIFGGGPRAAPQPQYAPPQPQQPQPQQPQYQQPQYAPPPQQYAPGYQPGMFQQRGSGFLGTALTTAAGVAGGMVAGNALMNLFSGGHGGGGGGFGGGGFGGGMGSPAASSQFLPVEPSHAQAPWASDPAPAADPYEVGGLGKDSGGWQQAAPEQGGWQDAAATPDSGGGWSDASSSSDDET